MTLHVLQQDIGLQGMQVCKQVVTDLLTSGFVRWNSSCDDPMCPEHVYVQDPRDDIFGDVWVGFLELKQGQLVYSFCVEACSSGVKEAGRSRVPHSCSERNAGFGFLVDERINF